jgi:hypothetical protein
MATPATLGLPLDEATYDTSECAKAALQSDAQDNGNGASVMPSRDSRTLYGCAKDEDEADDKALSQAIDTIINAERTRRGTQKALESAKQARSSKSAPKGNWGGPGGRCCGRKVWIVSWCVFINAL